MDAVFLAALFCGCVAALKGNRTAWFLLASAAFTSALVVLGMEFDPFFWMLIDLAVVMAIASTPMTRCDAFIIGLFVPAWAVYPLGGWTMYYVTSAVTAAQFLLVFPVPQLWADCSKPFRRPPPDDVMEFASA